MALITTFEAAPGVPVDNAYLMIGDIWFHFKDQTAEIFIFPYRNEEARRGNIEGILARYPIRIFVHQPQFEEFFTPAALSQNDNNPQKAAYQLLAKYEYPLGLKELFDIGQHQL